MDVDESTPHSDLERTYAELNVNEEDEFYVPPPPAAAFVANADGSRLIITRIVNENFKSYAGIQELGPFHKYFTAIIGPNGSGKSNVIDSMLFVFGYRANRMRSKKISAMLHDSPDYGKATSCTVTVHFALMIDVPDHLDEYTVVPGSEFYISRTVSADNSSFYTINGRRVQFKEVGELLRKHGIDLDHNRFLILQGEVEQISLMKPKGENDNDVEMLEYLEDIIGSSRFKNPISRLVKRVEEQSEIRDEKWNRCKMARDELQDMEGPMETAKRYIQLENSIIILQSQMLQMKIHQGEQEKQQNEAAVAEIDAQMDALKKELQEKRKQIKELKQSNATTAKELETKLAKKEAAKKIFDDNKLKDVALQQEIERANNKRKELKKNLSTEEEKKIRLEKVPEKNEETIAELDALEPKLVDERKAAEERHAAVMASLQTDTQSLQDEKEKLQTELAGLRKTVDGAKSKYDVANTELNIYTSREQAEKAKLEALNTRLNETVTGLENREKEIVTVSKTIETTEHKLTEDKEELEKLKRDLSLAEEQRRKHQLVVEENRVSMQSARGKGKVLDALMEAKQNGQLPGVFGRMGDLGGIDAKYDVAISTACGALDNIVVDTVDTAEQCIQFLKRNNIGSATFVALDKQERYRQIYSQPFQAPEGVPRLFDLVKVADDRVRPVFYFALQNTLVANNLEQASRIAYGATRYRVVTLNGELIEMAGTMSGGGNQVMKGRMGRNVEQQTNTSMMSPQDLERLERKLEEMTTRIGQLRGRIHALEEQISKNTLDLRQARTQYNKLKIEIDSLKSQEPMLRKQLQAQETRTKEATPDPTELRKKQKVVDDTKRVFEEASEKAEVVEVKVNKLHAEIVAMTKGRLDAAQKKLDEANAKLEKVRKEKTTLRVAVTTAARNLKKCEEKMENMKQQIADSENKIKDCARQQQETEDQARESLKEYEELNKAVIELKENNQEYQKEMDELLTSENALKTKEIDLSAEVSRTKAELDGKVRKIAVDKKRLVALKLSEEPFATEQPELKELTAEEMETLSIDDIMRTLKNKEESLPKQRPNLGAIQEYQRRRQVCLEREEDLEKATAARNRSRELMDKMKQTRLAEFDAGFTLISRKVRECYQMLAEGGDAELELINTIDPFMDGIRFTVRPPKKSWKEIQYLSGGEKTLSSLSLIFALHYYKPTPLYFMDEIDSALDWKNTAIVGCYLKEQTKNAQFIVVSLRENMFEIADQLVGIYKTHNCTKSVTIIPHKYIKEGSGDQEAQPVAVA